MKMINSLLHGFSIIIFSIAWFCTQIIYLYLSDFVISANLSLFSSLSVIIVFFLPADERHERGTRKHAQNINNEKNEYT